MDDILTAIRLSLSVAPMRFHECDDADRLSERYVSVDDWYELSDAVRSYSKALAMPTQLR
jgi:hypothetical protein